MGHWGLGIGHWALEKRQRRNLFNHSPLFPLSSPFGKLLVLIQYSGIKPTLCLNRDNEPQPDGVLLITPIAQGQSRLSDDDYIEGAPELVIEIAASSVAIDLHDKKKVYGRNRVKEYIVWQIFENKLDWFSLQQGEYVSLEVDVDGIIKSQVFPGLRLSMSNLLTGNMQQVLAVLQLGLNSPEH